MAVGEDEFTWNVEMEVGLFHAMRGHKPVGVNKNFQMMCIHEKFHQVTGKKISSRSIWKHLSTMYDMQALDESENLPFPNTQADFSLPHSDYGDLITTKRKDPDKPLAKRSSSVSSSDEGSSSKTDSLKATFRISGGAASLIATTTPSEKDNSPKRKRTRQAAVTTPSPGVGESSAKRRR
ncbi:uncharacterized protein [Amphiura filiformis]|uniref:uncharacterized protein n=1 Tax=Amphiura filiformis TaxID=82378 RepID=UPI003B20D6B6